MHKFLSYFVITSINFKSAFFHYFYYYILALLFCLLHLRALACLWWVPLNALFVI